MQNQPARHCNHATIQPHCNGPFLPPTAHINTVVFLLKRHHNAEPTCRTLQPCYHTATLQWTFSASHWYKMQHASNGHEATRLMTSQTPSKDECCTLFSGSHHQSCMEFQ